MRGGGVEMSAQEYINRIRNKAKRAYAEAYDAYYRAGEIGPEPKHTLSFMGAQAVRHNIHALYKEPTK